MNTGLECINVTLIRNRGRSSPVTVLKNITAGFALESMTLVSGRTGAGKTSLLNVLGAMIRPTEGRMLSEGQPISQWMSTHRDKWRRQVGIVFQHHHLVDNLTVLENVMLPMIPRGMPVTDLRRRCRELLEKVNLIEIAGDLPGTLSGGQRQRAALARALVARPRFVLADEPTAFQDDANCREILRILHKQAENGAAVIVCSHDPRVRTAAMFNARFILDSGYLVDGDSVSCQGNGASFHGTPHGENH